MNSLEEYYNNYDEEGRLLSKHGQVEYLTTMKYIKECLEGISEPNILEVGAGTEPINAIQGNALDLSMFEDDTFDMTMLLGPM